MFEYRRWDLLRSTATEHAYGCTNRTRKKNRSAYRFVVQTLDFACQIRRFPLQRRHVSGRFRVELRPRVLVGVRFHGIDVTPAAPSAVLVTAPMTLVRTPCEQKQRQVYYDGSLRYVCLSGKRNQFHRILRRAPWRWGRFGDGALWRGEGLRSGRGPASNPLRNDSIIPENTINPLCYCCCCINIVFRFIIIHFGISWRFENLFFFRQFLFDTSCNIIYPEHIICWVIYNVK